MITLINVFILAQLQKICLMREIGVTVVLAGLMEFAERMEFDVTVGLPFG